MKHAASRLRPAMKPGTEACPFCVLETPLHIADVPEGLRTEARPEGHQRLLGFEASKNGLSLLTRAGL